VTPAIARRAVALGGVALIAAIAALAIASRDGGSRPANTLPRPARNWYTALAGSYDLGVSRRKTACGQRIRPDTLGVAHPVLPCGVKVFIAYRGTRVLTQVIDRGPNVPGREFDLTKALADRIGLHGTQEIRWTFAR
jgi:rare lipoprotein A (peptidoglycan hydrolase)